MSAFYKIRTFQSTLLRFFVLFLFIMCISPVSSQYNWVINGDFETGNMTGWDLSATSGLSASYSFINLGGIYGNYTVNSEYPSGGSTADYSIFTQEGFDLSKINSIEWDWYGSNMGNPVGLDCAVYIYEDDILIHHEHVTSGWSHKIFNSTAYTGTGKFVFTSDAVNHPFRDVWFRFDNVEFLGEVVAPPELILNFTSSNYSEHDDITVRYDIRGFESLYPDEDFFIVWIAPSIATGIGHSIGYSDYINGVGYNDYTIGSIDPDYPEFDAVMARVVKSNATDPYDEVGTAIFTDTILDTPHTLLQFTGFDFVQDNSFITNSYIPVKVDLNDYMVFDGVSLGFPENISYTLHINGFSDSGNPEYFKLLDTNYWSTDSINEKSFSKQLFTDSNFNGTAEAYIESYNISSHETELLLPAINVSLWAYGYTPEGEDPDDPDDPELPDEPELPEIPENPAEEGNQSLNLTWTEGYYTMVNGTISGLFKPVQSFTAYAISPVTQLNTKIETFNTELSNSFTETESSIGIISSSFFTVTDGFPPKIRNVITYYLLWVVLLVILKKD